MLTMLFGEESSGPRSCVGFFYKKGKKIKTIKLKYISMICNVFIEVWLHV